jgi:hypothetical protein
LTRSIWSGSSASSSFKKPLKSFATTHFLD